MAQPFPRFNAELTRLVWNINALTAVSGKVLDTTERFYVYALLDPRKPGRWEYTLFDKPVVFEFEPFYIGKGTGRRMKAHVYSSVYGPSTPKQRRIRLIEKKGYNVFLKQCTDLEDEATAFAKERMLIKAIGRHQGPLLNQTDGGEGISGVVWDEVRREAFRAYRTGQKHSPETRRRMREAALGKPKSEQARLNMSLAAKARKRTPHSEETKAKMRAAALGRRQTEEAKAKLRAANLGKKASEETRAKMRLARARILECQP